MSPRAAARLESLAFEKVYDYMPGKMDWLAYGFPVEKKDHGLSLVIEHLQMEFPIARLGERVGEVRLRMEQAGFVTAAVLNNEGVLLGLLSKLGADADAEAAVDRVMDPGPTTIRPSVSVGNAVKQLDKLNTDELPITSSDGKLLGVFRRPKATKDERLHEAIG